MQRAEHDLVRIGEIALVLLVDFLQNFIQCALGVLYRAAALLGGNIHPVQFLQLDRALKGLLQLVVFEPQFAVQIDRVILLCGQQPQQITEEQILFLCLLVEHAHDLGHIAVPAQKGTHMAAELIAFLRVFQVVAIRHWL